MNATFRPASLANSLLFSTARIITTSRDQQSASGTGFVYKHTLKDEGIKDRGIPFLVTNRHVVADAAFGRIVFLTAADRQRLTATKEVPFAFTIGEFSDAWIYHPDPTVDLAIMDLSIYLEMAYETHRVQPFFRACEARDIPTDAITRTIDAIEDVFMIGYPNSLMDDVNHLPITRRGITATPFASNYQGRREFLIDASVFPGSSGSPIFLFDHQKPDTDKSKRLYLLGVLSAGFFRVQESQDIIRSEIPTTLTGKCYQEMLDLGVVVKSTRISELIAVWETQIAARSYKSGDDDEEKSRITDEDVNRTIYELARDLRASSWQDLDRVLGSTFAWHLLTKFKTTGLDPTERLCLYRLLVLCQGRRAQATT